MKKRHIPGFFDNLARTPAFLFLCAVFLCGALAGGLTGLHAETGDRALGLASLLSALPENAPKALLCSVIWIAVPMACSLLRPAALFLSFACAARGFVLALTIAISLASGGGFLLSICTAGFPALLSVPALLASCAMLWPGPAPRKGLLPKGSGGPYALCFALAAASALLRVGFAALWGAYT